MRARTMVIGGAVLALALVGCVCLVLLQSEPQVSEINFDRLAEGMTETEVAAILGNPSAGPIPFIACYAEQQDGKPIVEERLAWRWVQGEIEIQVDFDQRGVLKDKQFRGEEPEGLMSKLCRWLTF